MQPAIVPGVQVPTRIVQKQARTAGLRRGDLGGDDASIAVALGDHILASKAVAPIGAR